MPSSDCSRNHRRGEQTIVIAYQVTPAVFPTPGGPHQNAFLRAIAVYTCACFIPVIVSQPSSFKFEFVRTVYYG